MQAMDDGEQVAQPQTYRFVPDDICIVVTSEIPLDDASRKAIYDVVRGALNDARDRGELPLLEGREGRFPLFFDDDANGGTTAHLYYRQIVEGADAAKRADAVRNTVVQLNRRYVLPDAQPFNIFQDVQPAALQKLKIAAIAPHWIGVGCGGFDGDGPAAPPEPVEAPVNPAKPANWRFRFARPDGSRGNRRLQKRVTSARLAAAGDAAPTNVVVAILDTCPTNDAIHQAFTQFPSNSLLGQIGDPTAPPKHPRGNPVTVHGSLVTTTAEAALVADVLPHWSGGMDLWSGVTDVTTASGAQRLKDLAETEYAMPDHGLFVAGIIKDIAPTADIHLVRGLEDTGVTTLAPFTHTLQTMLKQDWANRHGTHLIVSLSLTFSVPRYDDEFKIEWKDALTGLTEDEKRTVYLHVHRNLKDVIDALAKRNVLVVAAVGNYMEPGAPRPAPRYPAIYDSVLAVAAVSREGRAARYTNRGDTLALSTVGPVRNGIATFGGDTDDEQDPRIIEREWREEPDAIRGLYSSMTFPLASAAGARLAATAGSNATGWVLWVGTSFATPIIAAIAALLWAEQSRTPPGQVVKASDMIGIVQGYADAGIDTQADLECGTIFAEQELIP